MTQPTTSGIVVQIHALDWARDLGYPMQAVCDSAGLDLRAAIHQDVVIRPSERVLIPTGLKMVIPSGYEGQVRPRSGLALREGITVLNSPGTIDAGYRGEIQVLLINLGQMVFRMMRGIRMAQLVFAPVVQEITWEEVDDLPDSLRGEGGFGSSGYS